MSIGKFRPATQANVGAPVKDLEEKEPKYNRPDPEPVKEEIPSPITMTAEANLAVNIRELPTPSASIVKVLFPGEKIQVTEYNNDWYKVVNLGKDCYVRKEFVAVK